MLRLWRKRSLRYRLAAWYSLAGVLLLSVFSATVYSYVAYKIARPLDVDLHRDLSMIRDRLTLDARGGLLWNGEPLQSEREWPKDSPWFELWDKDRNLIARFWPFDDAELEQLPAAPAPGRETISVFRITSDVRVRVLSLPAQLPDRGSEWMLRVIRIHRPSGDALRDLLLIVVISLPIVVVLLVIGGYLITRHWLEPLEEMVREANRITASGLDRRLPVSNANDEIGRLSTVFNETLARLEDSFRALDHFVADASHELLTPLTTLRSVGEVGLRGNRSSEEYRAVVESMLEEAQRLQLLVEKLLQLARAEGGSSIAEWQSVDIDALLAASVEDGQLIAEEKNQRIDYASIPCSLVTDELLFRQAFQNVLDNALKYSQPGSTVRVWLQPTQGGCEVVVADEGPGIPESYRAQLMNRFFRADKARGRASGGHGLGLAITKAYMRALGGTVSYEPNDKGGSTFRLRLQDQSPPDIAKAVEPGEK